MNDRSTGPIARTLPLLDWLRFGAALMVVVKHCKDTSFPAFSALPQATQALLTTKALYSLTRYGDEAVLIFFVLSGYLVGGSTWSRAREGSFDIWSYASDRASRILLPLLPAILLTVALQEWRGVPAPIGQILGNALSVQGVLTPVLLYNPSLWTLTYEVWFYILNGALIAILACRSRVLGPLIVFAALELFASLKLELLICWYLGMFASVWTTTRSTLLSMSTAIGLTGLGMLLNELAGRTGFTQYEVAAHLLLGFSVVLLVRQLAAVPPSDRVLMRMGSRLSGFSYSLYLIHYPILFWIAVWLPPVGALNPSTILVFLVRIVVCMCGGWLFFWLFERHTATVRRWIGSYRGRRAGIEDRSRAA